MTGSAASLVAETVFPKTFYEVFPQKNASIWAFLKQLVAFERVCF